MNIRIFIAFVGLLLLSPVPVRADSMREGVPERFVEDTVYHALLDLSKNSFTVSYGRFPLVSCPIESTESAQTVGGFASEWDMRSPKRWQSVTSRQALISQQSISDTVVEVVARVSNADPQQIRRIVPDRFRVDLSGDFRFVVVTEQGQRQGNSVSEAMQTTVRRLLSFGQLRVLTIRVSESDAQTLYYALEPGTPVVLMGAESIPVLSAVPLDIP